ncbi:MAG TPA: hypothetical protein VEK08_12630 [Planctomycetota bacterium]|nr:hypothetical protein [Planctomycetota bacterium]
MSLNTPSLFQGAAIASVLDGAGNRYTTGTFTGTVDFNPYVGEDSRSTPADSTCTYVTRYNADGTYAWTQTFGGTVSTASASITVCGSTVYVCGNTSIANPVFGCSGSFTFIGSSDAFVFAIDSASGTPISTFGTNGWVRFGGNNIDQASDVVSDGSTVFVCGGFWSSNAGIGGSGGFASAGSDDAFILAVDAISGVPVPSFASNGVYHLGTGWNDKLKGLLLNGSVLYCAGQYNSDAAILALDSSSGNLVPQFGNAGMQIFGGTSVGDVGSRLALSGITLFMAGTFTGTNAGFGGSGSVGTIGNQDAMVLAVDADTGLPKSSFGNGGVVHIGGTAHDAAVDVRCNGTKVCLLLTTSSTNLGLSSAGSISTVGSSDLVITVLDSQSGIPVPVWRRRVRSIRRFSL